MTKLTSWSNLCSKPNLFPGSGSFWLLTLCIFPSRNLVLPVEINANATSIRHPGPEAISLSSALGLSFICVLPAAQPPQALQGRSRVYWETVRCKWEEPVAVQTSQTPGNWPPAAFWAWLGPSSSQLDIFSIASVINFHKHSKLKTR